MGTSRSTNMDSTRPSTGIITGAHLSALELQSAHNRHVAYEPSSEVSPKSSTERPLLNVSPGPCIEADPCMEPGQSAVRSTNTSLSENEQTEDRHITVWNPLTGKKLSGNAAPFRRNLQKYLASHPDWEECLVTGDSKKRRKLSSCPSSKRTKTENTQSTPLYPWECLLAVARAHSQQVQEGTGPADSMASPRMHSVTSSHSFTQCMVG